MKTGLQRRMASDREGSRRLSGRLSHLKHKVYGTKPISSEATALPQQLWQQAGAGEGARPVADTTLTGTWTFGRRRLRERGAGSLLDSLLHLRLPLGFRLEVPALPFLEAPLLILCLRRKCKGKPVLHEIRVLTANVFLHKAGGDLCGIKY